MASGIVGLNDHAKRLGVPIEFSQDMPIASYHYGLGELVCAALTKLEEAEKRAASHSTGSTEPHTQR